MKKLFAGLTVCLLISLLLMTVADGLGSGYAHRSASLGLAVGRLWNRKWASAATWSDRGSWLFRIHAGEAGWRFAFDGWRWRNTHHQPRVRPDSSGRFLCQGTDIMTSVSIGFQGSVNSREQCAHLGSFVPKTR